MYLAVARFQPFDEVLPEEFTDRSGVQFDQIHFTMVRDVEEKRRSGGSLRDN